MLIDRNPMLVPTLPHVHAVIPGAPVVVVLRDPRDVCLSFYMQYLEPNEISSNLESLESTARYYMEVMAMWLKIRDYQSPRFLEVKYEDLVQSPDRAYQRILMHLGVEPHPLDPTPITPADGSVIMTPSYEAVTRPIYKTAVARWKNYQPHFEAAERILAPAIEAFGY